MFQLFLSRFPSILELFPGEDFLKQMYLGLVLLQHIHKKQTNLVQKIMQLDTNIVHAKKTI